MQTISGEVHHVLHDAHGVSIAMVPRLPSSVGEVLEWLGQLHLGDSDRRRLLQAALFLQAWSRSLQRRRRWFYVIRKLYFAGFQCMPVHSCPRLRHGCRPDWWWPKRSREVRALQDLGEIHYWSRPVDPSWFERDVELMPCISAC